MNCLEYFELLYPICSKQDLLEGQHVDLSALTANDMKLMFCVARFNG